MTACKQWIRRVGCLTVGMLIAVVALNLVIDPYDLYRIVAIPWINMNKPVATRHGRMIKPNLVRRYQFQALVMGSSRAEIGINPDHPGWAPRYRPAFNYALGGAGIQEVAERFEEVVEQQPVGQVVLGLDFFMFNALLDNPLAVESEGELSLERLPGENMKQWYLTLATAGATGASIETLHKQNRVRYPGYLRNGQIDTTFNVKRTRRIGHRKNFERIEKQYLDNNFFPPPRKIYRFVHPESGASSFDALRRILDLARSKGVDLKLYISPCHALMLEVIAQAGLWPEYESWKRELTAIVAAEAAAGAGRAPFPLWDFSGYNSVTTEELPAAGDRQTKMRYYWEASHFKSETGDLLLDRLFAWQEPGRVVPEDFGVPLAAANVEAYLAETLRRQHVYRQAHPQEVAEIAALAATMPHLNR